MIQVHHTNLHKCVASVRWERGVGNHTRTGICGQVRRGQLACAAANSVVCVRPRQLAEVAWRGQNSSGLSGGPGAVHQRQASLGGDAGEWWAVHDGAWWRVGAVMGDVASRWAWWCDVWAWPCSPAWSSPSLRHLLMVRRWDLVVPLLTADDVQALSLRGWSLVAPLCRLHVHLADGGRSDRALRGLSQSSWRWTSWSWSRPLGRQSSIVRCASCLCAYWWWRRP